MRRLDVPAIHPGADSGAAGARSRSRALWIAGVLLILLALGVGKSIEDRLAAAGMPQLGSGDLSPAQLAPLLFAFAFPLGLALCAWAALGPRDRTGIPRPALAVLAVLAVTAPVLVPIVLGRELIPYQFGAGGIIITLGALAVFRAIGRLRRGLSPALATAANLATLGLLCLAAAAWNLCGAAAMPSFLLMPERLAQLGSLPFAIGQMKAVLVLLALGWVLLAAAAMLAASRLGNDRSGD